MKSHTELVDNVKDHIEPDDFQFKDITSSERVRMSFEDTVRLIRQAPATWLPALLGAAVTASVKKGVFRDSGLEGFVVAAKMKAMGVGGISGGGLE